MADSPHILIVEARFYEDIADELARGAITALEAAGGGWLMPQDALSIDSLSERLAALIATPDSLAKAAAAAKAFGTTEAAEKLADAVMRLAGIDIGNGGGNGGEDSHARQEVAA